MAKPWIPIVVQQGDHLGKLAFLHGIDAAALWSNEKNKPLADKRKSPDMLCPGDVLFVPVEPAPALDISAGSTNKYKATVPTVPVTVHLESKRRAFGNQPFEVHGASAGDDVIRGTTTADGQVKFDVPVLVREVEVRLPALGVVVPVHVGDLDPIDEPSGVAQRLRHLGFLGDDGEVKPATLAAALRAFQRSVGVEQTGVADAATVAALEKQHLA